VKIVDVDIITFFIIILLYFNQNQMYSLMFNVVIDIVINIVIEIEEIIDY